jgi:glycerol-3-phosphate cytidylyltransferase
LYSATKSALFRFVESVNIELEKSGSPNRILNICPGSLDGTSFYGNKTDIGALQSLTDAILEHLKNRTTLFIPQYNETYNSVIKKKKKNNHQFGLESYDYKMKSGRINNNPSMLVGYLSGTFDLFHIGHLNIIKRAREQCDYLIVGVHKDGTHKGKNVFIPFDERCEVIRSLKYVDKVIESKPEDIDVYEEIKYNILFVGSDYKGTERFIRYERYFEGKNVQIIYFPYTDKTSSTKLRMVIDDALNEHNTNN